MKFRNLCPKFGPTDFGCAPTYLFEFISLAHKGRQLSPSILGIHSHSICDLTNAERAHLVFLNYTDLPSVSVLHQAARDLLFR